MALATVQVLKSQFYFSVFCQFDFLSVFLAQRHYGVMYRIFNLRANMVIYLQITRRVIHA